MLDKSDDKTFDDPLRLRTNKRNESDTQRVDPDEVIAKVIEDINFLRGRINHIKRALVSSRTPTILATYESMLKSREAVLSWLQDGLQDGLQNDSHDDRYKSARAN